MTKKYYNNCQTKKNSLLTITRENIKKILFKFTIPISHHKIARIFKISKKEEMKTLRRCLRAMKRDRQIISIRNQCYILSKKMNVLKGTIIGHRDGFGFLRIEGQKEDCYLSFEEMKKAIHGDIVLVKIIGKDRKGKMEVSIIRVLESRNNHIIGHYYLSKNGISYVVPNDNRLLFNITIPKEKINGAKIGNIVVVLITRLPSRYIKLIGEIIEILGETMCTNIVIKIALRTYNIPYLWPLQVQKQISDLSDYIPISEKKRRINLCHLPFVTIDDEDAKDYDDAVYCMPQKSGGWYLWVAIADVSHYVKPQTAVDKEAINRGNSVYFFSYVIPMLPEILSNVLCSLNPNVERLCIVCEIHVSSQGEIKTSKFYESIIYSHARLTYNQVWNILQGDSELRIKYKNIIPYLEQLYEFYKILKIARFKRGSISFESEEVKFIFNSEKRIKRIETFERNDAHKIIEECMILANIAAARFVEHHQEPSLYRIHDCPKTENIINLHRILNEFGLTLPGGLKPKPSDYAKIMNEITQRPDHELLQTMILRSMTPALYDSENRGHFGLALKSYAHFTSPIRRYPDLVLHRSIKYILSKQFSKNKNNSSLPNSIHSGNNNNELSKLGIHCFMTSRRAEEATREVSDWLKCDFMKNQIGNIFIGIITSVTTFGFFVRLKNLYIDGLVHISSLNNDFYHYDNIRQCLLGESSKIIYRLGDTVKIKVQAINMNERKIDFILITTLNKNDENNKK